VTITIDSIHDEFDALADRYARHGLPHGEVRKLTALANAIAAEGEDDITGNDVIDAVLVEHLVPTRPYRKAAYV
jgi:hypothetical protein